MVTAPKPTNETLRIAALDRFSIMNTDPDASYDQITSFAASIFNVPIAVISFINQDQQWVKSGLGLKLTQTKREDAFCAYTILDSKVLIVPDVLADERFSNNVMARGEPFVRFYAGAPLTTKDGYNIGSLCLIDTNPRNFSTQEEDQLTKLAAIVIELLQARLAGQTLLEELKKEREEFTKNLDQNEQRFHLLVKNSTDLISRHSLDGTILYMSPACFNILGYQPEELIGHSPYEYYFPEDILNIQQTHAQVIELSDVSRITYRFRHKNGSYIWLETTAQAVINLNGNMVEIQSSSRDVSTRKAAEAALKETTDQLKISETRYQESYYSVKRQAQELDILHKIRGILFEEMDLKTLFQRVVEAISQEFGYPHVSLFHLQNNTLLLQHQVGYTRTLSSLAINDENVFGADDNNYIESLYTTPANSGGTEVKNVDGNNPTEIFIPLFDTSTVVGMLIVGTNNDKSLISSDLEIMKALGEYISLAINRNKVYLQAQENDARFRNIINNAPLIFYTLDPEGKFTYSAGKGLTALGLEPNEIIGYSSFELYAHNPVILSDIQRALKGETFRSFVNENSVSFESFYTPVKNEKEEIVSVLGLSINVTEKKEAEKELQANREFTEQILQSMGQGLVVLSFDLTIRFTNPALAKMLAYSQEELVGHSILDFIPFELRKKYEKLLVQQSPQLKRSDYEVDFLKKDDTKLQTMTVVEPFYRGTSLDGIILVISDLAAKKNVEQQLRLALEKEKELVEMKNQLITTASHEFRTPLTGIISSVELLEFYSHSWSEEKKREVLSRITQAANKLTSLVESVLVYNRGEAGKLSCVRVRLDLRAFCRDLIETFTVLTVGNKKIEFIEQGEGQPAFLDANLLTIILNNLLSNALKYSHNNCVIKLNLEWQIDTVIFKIKDEGIGIPANDQVRVFEPFQRASNVGTISGTGFGLAIVKQSVLAHGGNITLNSMEGQGTTFSVKLPLSEKTDKTTITRQIRVEEVAGQSKSGPVIKSYVDMTQKSYPEGIIPTWKLLEQSIDSINSGIIITDPRQENNPLIFANKGFEDLTGFLKEEVIGKNCRFLQGEDGNQPGIKILKQAIKEEQDCKVVVRNYRKDGSMFWNEIQLSAIRNKAGEVTFYVGIQNDVTSRIKTEIALQQSEQKFKTLVENSPDLIAQFDKNGVFLYVNPSIVNIFDESIVPEYIIGKSITTAVFPIEELDMFKHHLDKVIETGELASFEITSDIPDKPPKYLQVQVVPEFNLDSQEISSILTISRDITVLKQINEALQQSQLRLVNILETITDGFFTLDLNWNVTYINYKAEVLLQQSREKVIGWSIWKVFSDSAGSNFREMLNLARQENISVHFDSFFEPSGKWLDVYTYPTEEGISVYFQDISHSKPKRNTQNPN